MNKKERNTGFAFRLLHWFCPAHLVEEIEGDLMQKFSRDVNAKAYAQYSSRYRVRRAKLRLFWNVIRFFRPGIVMRSKFSIELNQMYMLWNYLKLAGRGLARNKMFSMINVLGLSVSTLICLLILQYVRFELSYDDFHTDAKNIYRVATKVTLQDEVIVHETNTYDGISKALNMSFPEVKAATSIRSFNSDKTFIRYENDANALTPLPAFKGFDVDSTFFKVFSFPFASGNPQTALQQPYSVVITESLARQCFFKNPIGKIFELYDGETTQRYTITGVLKDIPENSHIKFNLLTRSRPRTKNFWNGDVGFWDWGGQTYVVLHEYSNHAGLESKLGALAVSKNGLKNNKNDYGQVSTFELQPLTDIHLYSHLQDELEVNGSSALINALIVLAAIILIIAWVNYINLSTAISEQKIKAIGIRKIVGASRLGLMLQVLTESSVFNVLGVIIAYFTSYLILPAFCNFSGIPLNYSLLYDQFSLTSLVAFIFVGTCISGLYPAYVISSFYPVRALKHSIQFPGRFSLRKVLVVFQFTAAGMVMIATVVAYQQLSFMRQKDLGITIDRVVIVKALNFDKEMWSNAAGGFVLDSAYLHKANLFNDEVRSQANFLSVTSLSHVPGQLPNWGTEFKASSIDNENAYRLAAIGIDYDFLQTFKVKLLAGRNFSHEFPSDRGNEGKRAVLINEAASNLLGFKSAKDAVHKHISTYWGADYEVIGIVNSFHQLSVKENLQPLYFILQPRALEYFAVLYNGHNATDAIEKLRSIWSRHFPDYPFNYFFLDQYFDQQYRYDQKFSEIMRLFSGLTIFIACLGLFGLTSYAIIQRTKEIGIRKVLGASISNIIGLFTSTFIRLILLAASLAIPVAYFGSSYWLENYAYKIDLRWWIFVTPTALILVIALITLSLQTFKVAARSPVDSLKHD
jgi:putative ABC transport system permease protein